MLIHSYTSSKEVINNFFRNTGTSEHINYGDVAYWIYECMELIGTPMQYIPKVVGHTADDTYTLTSYRVQLPIDIHRLIAVSVDGILCMPSTGFFHQLMDGSCCGYNTNAIATDNFYDNFGNQFSPQALPLNTRIVTNPPTFTVNNTYITFDIKEGNVCLAYWAFPMDDEGFPLIPDDIRYKRAVSSYIEWKFDKIMYKRGELSRDIYEHSHDESIWAMGSAKNWINTPDVNQMESLKRQLTKMIVRNEEYQTAFSALNNKGLRGRY